jgi:excinuclease ABC subunit B
MKRMMEVTGHRRELQIAYNLEHGIIPQTIIKSVEEIELSTRVADARSPKEAKVAEKRAEYVLGGKDPEVMLKELEDEMRDAAARLDFERAALLGDQLLELRAEMDGGKKKVRA